MKKYTPHIIASAALVTVLGFSSEFSKENLANKRADVYRVCLKKDFTTQQCTFIVRGLPTDEVRYKKCLAEKLFSDNQCQLLHEGSRDFGPEFFPEVCEEFAHFSKSQCQFFHRGTVAENWDGDSR